MKICVIGAGPSTYYLTKHLHTHAPSTTVHVFERRSSPLQSLNLFSIKPRMHMNSVLCNIKVHGSMLERLSTFYDGVVVAVGGRARRLGDGLNKFTVYGEDVIRKGNGLERVNRRSAWLLENVLKSSSDRGNGESGHVANWGAELKNGAEGGIIKIEAAESATGNNAANRDRTLNENNTEHKKVQTSINKNKTHELAAHAKAFSKLRRVAIVGAGDVSLDVASMLYTHGVPQIFILSRAELAKCAFSAHELRKCVHDKNVCVQGGVLGDDRKGRIVRDGIEGYKMRRDGINTDKGMLEVENGTEKENDKNEMVHKEMEGNSSTTTFGTPPVQFNRLETNAFNRTQTNQSKQTLYLLLNTVLQSIRKKASSYNLTLQTKEGNKELKNIDLVVNCTGYTGRDLSRYVCDKPVYFLGWCKDARGSLGVVKGRAVELADRMIDELDLK
ncbi:hypothetical protein VCUG_01982 [Vavraia culicis subsp. floridensis]|uniref:FAD/NAD(P)-binding domain-containing protein n=1 Tax=Vavraia culicis (isolate floridensis) TaxID=948595 RepID=L2GSE3_VAVCU|nr:uncharacterized protein VCUG_01982 [Vavraia culicis subsp. floridensis]ELA46549.1 hypothetical protein VCUG_01982 [Vavraia culicis subsp. floridensis]